jgi:glycosyltransferase involved in cell wall biosynthesis
VVIPNAVSFPPSSDDSPAPWKEVRPTVLFVGRLDRVKGVPLLLEAAQRVISEKPDTRFVLAGNEHPTLTRSEVERTIDRLSLGSHIELVGHVSRQRLRSLYLASDVVVVPSYYETFGLSALEAMLMARPVVVTASGALPELVEDGVSGLVVPPGMTEPLSRALIRLLDDPGLRTRMGAAGSARAKNLFSVERVVDSSLELYKRVIAVYRERK